MKNFYKNHSIKIILGGLTLGLIIMYFYAHQFVNQMHLNTPTFTRDVMTRIDIVNFIGKVEIKKGEPGTGFKMEYSNKEQDDRASFYPFFQSVKGVDGMATIDGRYAKTLGCEIETDGANLKSAKINERDGLSLEPKDYPIVTIYNDQPMTIRVEKSHLFGDLGDVKDLQMHRLGCSLFSVNGIEENLRISDSQDVTIVTPKNLSGLKLEQRNSQNIKLIGK